MSERPKAASTQERQTWVDSLTHAIRQRLLPLFSSRGFARNVAVLSAGVMVSQVIRALITPISSRLYTPESFGLFATFLSVSSLIYSISTLRYEAAIVQTRSRTEANAVFSVCVALCGISSGLTLVGVSVYALVSGTMPSIYWLLPLSVLVTSLYTSAAHRANWQEFYPSIARARIYLSSSAALSEVGFGIAGLGASGLALSNMLSHSLGAASLLIRLGSTLREASSRLKAIRRYIRFPLYSTPAALLNVASSYLTYPLLGSLFTTSEVGGYFLLDRIVELPRTVLASSIWQVLLKESASLSREQVDILMQARQAKLCTIFSLAYYSTALTGAEIFVIILGQEWAPYADLLRPMFLTGHVVLVASSFNLFIPLRENRAELVYNTLLLVSKVTSVLVCSYLFHDLLITVTALCITQAILFAGLAEWNYIRLGQPPTTFLRLYGRAAVKPALPFLIPLILIYLITDSALIHMGGYALVNFLYVVLHGGRGIWRKALS